MIAIQDKQSSDKIIHAHNYQFKYNNLDSANQTISEIFDDKVYQFILDNPSPFIIDAGSNIGRAACYFKQAYPNAKLLCFEPDNNAYEALSVNISANKLSDIQTIHAALSGQEGAIDFYGQFHGDSPDARGNSIIQSRGLQRAISRCMRVPSVLLSNYVNKDVDFLKLDIEGAEQQVIEDLAKTNKLRLIKEISLEVHQTSAMQHINNISTICKVLVNHHFKVTVTEKSIDNIFPDETRNWFLYGQPRIYHVSAKI